jgi:large subunit ribosomal protein L3
MTIGLIGRKVGMTQLFQADGTMIPVSVVSVEPNIVTRLRTPERARDRGVRQAHQAGDRAAQELAEARRHT